MRDTLKLDGRRVANLAARRGLLRGELGERSGVTSATIAKVLSGRPIGVRTAREVARVLKTPLAELLASEPDSPVAVPSV